MSAGQAANEGLALVQLATRRGFISPDAAVGITHDIESGITLPGTKPVAELLVAKGHITGPQADLLLSEVAKAAAPKIIGGHQLVAKLGQGGMGAVYKAIQLSMQREVALKVLTPALAKDKDFIERFTREARAAGKVVHPNVITCFDVGMDHGVAYMSLELVRGGDAMKLANDQGGRLPEAQAVTIIRDCAKGLGAIAKAGLIHRDIKPANIFVSQDGDAKLADLGLARSVDGDDRMTQTGATIGSPAYMSPEQARGQSDLDIRTDIYSLGASLYHLLVGQPPFSGTTVFATVAKVINEPAPDPRALNPAVSAAACAIVAKTMAKARDERFRTADELVAALDALFAGRLSAPSAPAPVRPAHAHRSGPHHVARARPRRLRVGIAIAAAVAVVVLAIATGGGDDRPAPATATARITSPLEQPAATTAPAAAALLPAPAAVAPAKAQPEG
ncbi:MAG: serine/threonine protein kinase, partial [Planctomycetes bacterium]|nr:serine/threonine protein kinase [Planctomycetota bacterium]